MKHIYFLIILFTVVLQKNSFAQYSSEYNGGYMVKLNPSGEKYIRFLLWGQAWFQDNEGKNDNDGFSVKRARLLTYAQLNDRFLILTHFGANGINASNMHPGGKNNSVSLFLHEMFVQFKVVEQLHIGAGIHYYNCISRGNGQGTINILMIDNNRADWSTQGLSDQACNHLGIFAKGNINRLNYRFALNDAITTTNDGNNTTVLQEGDIKYLGKSLLGKGKYISSGYIDYQFLDKESNALPYRVGTYLGDLKVFNIGAGFSHHQNGLVRMQDGELKGANASHFAIDAFYDAPIGSSSSLTAYAKYQYSSMGGNYTFGNVVGDGNQISGHVGYLIPKRIKDGQSKSKNRLQPYVGYSYRDFHALNKPAQEMRIGANWFVDGNNARISIEYSRFFDQARTSNEGFTIQAMIFL